MDLVAAVRICPGLSGVVAVAEAAWRCVLEVAYPSEARARAVHGALAPDNATFVRARCEGPRLIAEAAADTPLALLHTLEDYLACLAVAEKAVGAAEA